MRVRENVRLHEGIHFHRNWVGLYGRMARDDVPVPPMQVNHEKQPVRAMRAYWERGELDQVRAVAEQTGYEIVVHALDGGDYAWCKEILDDLEDPHEFFHCQPDGLSHLQLAPYELFVLINEYRWRRYRGAMWGHLHLAQRVFLDSGQITLLKAAAKAGEEGREQDRIRLRQKLLDRMDRQQDLVETAWAMHFLGVRNLVVAMMDCPCEPDLLEKAGIDRKMAIDLTIRNAIAYQELDVEALPPGTTKCYVTQGWTLEDYERVLADYEWAGILGECTDGEAWLAAGSTCMRTPKTGLYEVYELHHNWAPTAHKHALGIAQGTWVGYMYRKGWIQSSDSGTASTSVGYNRGPERVEGKRNKKQLRHQFVSTMRNVESEVVGAVSNDPVIPKRRGRRMELRFNLDAA